MQISPRALFRVAALLPTPALAFTIPRLHTCCHQITNVNSIAMKFAEHTHIPVGIRCKGSRRYKASYQHSAQSCSVPTPPAQQTPRQHSLALAYAILARFQAPQCIDKPISWAAVAVFPPCNIHCPAFPAPNATCCTSLNAPNQPLSRHALCLTHLCLN